MESGPHRLGIIGNVEVFQYVIDLASEDLVSEEAALTQYLFGSPA
jgi:hypothetical protein